MPHTRLALLMTIAISGCTAAGPGDLRGSGEDGEGSVPRDWSGPWVQILEPADGAVVENPVGFSVNAEGVQDVSLAADGWALGSPWDPLWFTELSYTFSGVGYERVITLTGLDAWGDEVASHSITITVIEPGTSHEDTDTGADPGPADCLYYESSEQEYAPVQTTGSGVPAAASSMSWGRPASKTYLVGFSGNPGYSANHEGVDYVHDNASVADVDVNAAADGEVVYVRIGCPESSLFSHNDSLRECGSGWGNHVVVHHGDGVYMRYAHLRPGYTLVDVGYQVTRGQYLGRMGNSGRSETRHLHLELGTKASGFDPCAPAQSMDAVHDPELLSWL